MLAAIEREESRSAEEKDLAVREIHELEAERAAHTERVAAMRAELEACKRAENEAAAAVAAARSRPGAARGRLGREPAAAARTWSAAAPLCASGRMPWSGKRRRSPRSSPNGGTKPNAKPAAPPRWMNAARWPSNLVAEKDKQRAELCEPIDSPAMQVQRLQGHKEEARLAFEQARGPRARDHRRIAEGARGTERRARPRSQPARAAGEQSRAGAQRIPGGRARRTRRPRRPAPRCPPQSPKSEPLSDRLTA